MILLCRKFPCVTGLAYFLFFPSPNTRNYDGHGNVNMSSKKNNNFARYFAVPERIRLPYPGPRGFLEIFLRERVSETRSGDSGSLSLSGRKFQDKPLGPG